MNISAIIQSFRLRTLPLASACIMMGGVIAAQNNKFNPLIFTFTWLTTVFLQILSNLANDYGDSQNGADNQLRVGPKRAVQSGEIAQSEMKLLINIFIGISFLLGFFLLVFSFGLFSILFWVFLLLGILCIAAAYYYTAGKKPYGYSGLGDISVFVFFGLVGVCGSVFLHTKEFQFLHLLPAFSVGLLSVAVLNLNNMRDIDADTLAKKQTIPVRIGYIKSKYYHFLLIAFAFIFSIIYHSFSVGFGKTMYFIAAFILMGIDLKYIITTQKGDRIDHLLKKTALFTLLFVVLFGLGVLT